MQMMRCALVLGGVYLAAASVDSVKCSINAARSVDEMLDSAAFIWASIACCGKPGHQLKCEIDVANAAESVNGMANVIVHAIHDCGGIKGNACGMAAGKFTQAAAGLAAAAGGIYDKCANHVNPPAVPNLIQRPLGKWAYCLIDGKDAMRSLFKAVQRILTAEKACKEHSENCGETATSIVAAFAAMGQYGTDAVGKCSVSVPAVPQPHAKNLECATHISETLRYTMSLSAAAAHMSNVCEETHARLYELDLKSAPKATPKPAADSTGSTILPLAAVAALLPLTAAVSFLGGDRLAKYKQQQQAGTLMLDAEALAGTE